MGKNKLLRFEENKTFTNLFQPEFDEIKNNFKFSGTWSKDFFLNNHPVVLELGCGKGEYTLGLAKKYPGVNYIGIDKKGARLWRGSKTSQIENIQNAAFLRIKIEQIGYCFGAQEVQEIWITFPDPVPKVRKVRTRLTSPNFMNFYKSILKPGGVVHLKTDNETFYNYTLDVIKTFNGIVNFQTKDLYHSDFTGDAFMVQTYYEHKYLGAGKKIHYLRFKFQDETS